MSFPSLCRFSGIFGQPGEGAHSFRLFNIAVVDVIAVFVVALVLWKIFKWNFWVSLLVLFMIGIIAHRLFCVRTTIDKLLFP